MYLMKNISSRDIQVYVAGALTLIGFRALTSLPYYLSVPHNNVRIISLIGGGLITSLALPLGVTILTGKARALLLTQMYLWLSVFFGFASLLWVCCLLRPVELQHIWKFAMELLVNILLLWLVSWSLARGKCT